MLDKPRRWYSTLAGDAGTATSNLIMQNSWIFQNASGRSIWISWVLLCIAVSLIQFQTLEIDPPVNQDEVQIIDLGRTILDPESNWSMTWYVQGAHPTLYYSYLGIAVQELAFRASSPSSLGPRLMAMLAAIFAASCALGWLINRNTPPIVAMLIALAFLIDPIFSNIYRGGRIDGWALGACMASCWLLCLARARSMQGHPIKLQVFGAGVFLALSFFLWASAPILFPLVLLECFYLGRALAQSTPALRDSWWRAAGYFCLGGFLITLVLIIPILVHLDLYAGSARAMFESQAQVAGVQNPVFGLFAVYDPAFLLAVLAALLIRRDWGLLAALGLALLIAHRTAIYLPRITYFIPYGLAVIAFAYAGTGGQRVNRYAQLARHALLAVLIGFNALQVLVKRPLLASAQRPANEPAQLVTAMEQAIGPGAHRVLIEEWQTYYAGRALGWKMFLYSNSISDEEYARFLSTMDFVIIRKGPGWYGTFDLLEPAGFELVTRVEFSTPGSGTTGVAGFDLNVPQVSYPTLDIYRKRIDQH